MTTGKTIALTRWTFVSKIMSLLYNTLSRFVIAFLPRGKCLLISWLQSPSAVNLEPRKIKCHSFQRNPRADLLQNGLAGSPCSQGTLKSLLQHHSSKASIVRRSAFFTVQLSHPYMTTGKTIALTRRTLPTVK